MGVWKNLHEVVAGLLTSRGKIFAGTSCEAWRIVQSTSRGSIENLLENRIKKRIEKSRGERKDSGERA